MTPACNCHIMTPLHRGTEGHSVDEWDLCPCECPVHNTTVVDDDDRKDSKKR